MKKFRITVNGTSYDVDVEEIKGGVPQAPAAPQAPAPQPTASPAATPTSGSGATKIEAPMQGKIVSVKVAEGEMVSDGDVVAVLEAMKMENEIVAAESGTVASINVAAGQSVDVGDVIITLD